MLRPGSAIKRKQKPLAAKTGSNKQQAELKLPDANALMRKRDWNAALTIFDCDRKYSSRHNLKTYLGIAYCSFHKGDYKKAMDIYDELIGRSPDYDRNLHAYKACCLYALCNYAEAKTEATKGDETS